MEGELQTARVAEDRDEESVLWLLFLIYSLLSLGNYSYLLSLSLSTMHHRQRVEWVQLELIQLGSVHKVTMM